MLAAFILSVRATGDRAQAGSEGGIPVWPQQRPWRIPHLLPLFPAQHLAPSHLANPLCPRGSLPPGPRHANNLPHSRPLCALSSPLGSAPSAAKSSPNPAPPPVATVVSQSENTLRPLSGLFLQPPFEKPRGPRFPLEQVSTQAPAHQEPGPGRRMDGGGILLLGLSLRPGAASWA